MTTTKQQKDYSSVINSIKEKNIPFYTINIGKDVEFYISDISRTTLKKVGKLMIDKPTKAFEIILKDVFLGGDRDVFEKSTVFISAMPHVLSLIEPYKTKITENDDGTFKVIVDNKFKCSLKQIDIPTLSTVLDLQNRGDIFGSVEMVLKKCWIDGDETIKTDTRKFLSIVPIMEYMLKIKQGSIKKN